MIFNEICISTSKREHIIIETGLEVGSIELACNEHGIEWDEVPTGERAIFFEDNLDGFEMRSKKVFKNTPAVTTANEWTYEKVRGGRDSLIFDAKTNYIIATVKDVHIAAQIVEAHNGRTGSVNSDFYGSIHRVKKTDHDKLGHIHTKNCFHPMSS